MRLEGKVAIISGGARGMGAVEAKLFANEGAKIVVADILDEEGQKTVEEINELGGEATFVHLDVTDEDDWARAVLTAESMYSKVDILVNNAGIFHVASIEDTSLDSWDSQMDINAKGVFLGTKAVVSAMKKAGGGSIVNISSLAALVGGNNTSAYAASKAAVRIFTKSTAVEYSKDKIRANSVHPGIIETPMTSDNLKDPDFRRPRIENTPIQRIGTSEDVAYGVLFLASDESSYVTGAELVIDGGRTAI